MTPTVRAISPRIARRHKDEARNEFGMGLQWPNGMVCDMFPSIPPKRTTTLTGRCKRNPSPPIASFPEAFSASGQALRGHWVQ